jgi:alkylglycerol monooxygenase
MRTWNPMKINFKHLALLVHDAWRAPRWQDKFSIWFKPTGWRPEGFEDVYPVYKIEDPYRFEKYHTPFALPVRIFIWIQFLSTLLLLVWFFNGIQHLQLYGLLSFGALIFLMVYTYTDFMDKNRSSLFFAFLTALFGAGMLLGTPYWDPLFAEKGVFLGYLVFSFLGFTYFTLRGSSDPYCASL